VLNQWQAELHENETEVDVFGGDTYLSNRAKGNHSAAISAYWSTSTIDGILSSTDMKLHVGVIEYFFKHSATIATDTSKKVISHVFACVCLC